MNSRKKTARYLIGTAALVTTAGFILTVFLLLSHTEMEDLLLGTDAGWRYELLSGSQVCPCGQEAGTHGCESLPEVRAVRITRVMTEQLSEAQLSWTRWKNGIEVFLDGMPLHSDFPHLTRNKAGFVFPAAKDWERLLGGQDDSLIETRMTLPPDYLGKELSVTTYFPEGMTDEYAPEYPYLSNPSSPAALPVVSSVRDNIIMTLYALMALLMPGLFLMDSRNKHPDGKLLLLSLFYLLLFLSKASLSGASSYSVLHSRMNLRFLNWSYMAPLFLYLILRLRWRWKWPLFAGAAIWALYEAISEYRFYALSPQGTTGSKGPGCLAVMMVIAAAYLTESRKCGLRLGSRKKTLLHYCLTAGIILAVYVIDRAIAWGSLRSYLADGVWKGVCMGNFEPLITPITSVISLMSVIVVVGEIIHRTMDTRLTLDVFRERNQLIEANYHQMEQCLQGTALLRHEWKNQMTSLRLLAEQGSYTDLAQILEQMDNHLAQLSMVRYCDNYTVNVLLQNAAARASELGIAFIASAPLPKTLGIDERDLCSLLINMLDNALEAASGTSGKGKINISLKVVQDILSVRCENSYSEPLLPDENGGFASTKSSPQDHGWGIRQMRWVAKKYNGILDITHTDNLFTIQTALSMRI